MANIEQATASDNQLLEKVMSKEKYEILKSYNIKIALFYKYGKRDKEGNLKTTALSKNGVPSITLAQPCRYIHAPSSITYIKDIKDYYELSKLLLNKLAGGEFND